MSMVTSLPQKLEKLKTRTLHFDILKEISSKSLPVQPSIKELENYELPVIGTFIHRHILPGFRYRVRLGGTNEYLFDGKALKLESTGQGYGKRITFESDDILDNNNFFWSDSHETGFVFSPEFLSGGEVFEAVNCQDERVGSFSVDSVKREQQITRVALENDVINIQAKANVSGSLQMFSPDEKKVYLTGEVILKISRVSCTLEFSTKTDSDIALHFIKHFK